MWITIFLVCLAVIFSCSAQVTNNDFQTVTETARANQEVDWDTTGPSVTLSITDGRSDNANAARDEISNPPSFYSNQWQPYLLPIGYNNYGDVNSRHQVGGEDGINYQFMPTFLRRPDSDQNLTTSSRFTPPFNSFRYPFLPQPIPMAPINPMFFYPQQPNMFPAGNYRESGISSVIQNSSAPASGNTVSATEASDFRGVQENIVPPPPFATLPGFFDRFNPISVFRNRDDFIPSTPPAFVPAYPAVPNTNENSLHPAVFPFMRTRHYDREAGSDDIESILLRQDVPESDTSAAPKDIQDPEGTVANGTPSDSSPTFVPPEPLPLPVAGFPFGVLPPPIFPPIMTGPATNRGLPFNPLPEPANIPNERILPDAFLQQPPVPANFPPLDSLPDVLPPVNALEPKADLPETIETNAGGPLPEEKPNDAKIPYEFGFDMNDGQGTDQHRKEVSDISGTVRGSYGYRDMFGVYRIVNYIADKNGFRAFIKSNEPGVASSGSADVVVLAERPPPQAIAEGQRATESAAVIVPDAVTDLVAEGSETTLSEKNK